MSDHDLSTDEQSSELNNYTDKVAIITGGSRGSGQSTVLNLAKRGVRCAIDSIVSVALPRSHSSLQRSSSKKVWRSSTSL